MWYHCRVHIHPFQLPLKLMMYVINKDKQERHRDLGIIKLITLENRDTSTTDMMALRKISRS